MGAVASVTHSPSLTGLVPVAAPLDGECFDLATEMTEGTELRKQA